MEPITTRLRAATEPAVNDETESRMVICDAELFEQLCDEIDAIDANLAQELENARSERIVMMHVLTDLSTDFARNLRKVMARAGVSQAELARRMKVSRACVCRWYWGSRMPSDLTILRLRRALGCKKDELVGNEKEALDGIKSRA